MNIGGGEAADQLVRMMLSFGEVSVRLGGSALKNVLALSMALAKNNKTISGKINLGKMLRETRDLRQFPMSPEQYRQFAKLAKKQKILFSAIHDNVDTSSRILCYDIRDLGKQLLPVGMLVVLDSVFNRIIHNRKMGRNTWVYIDEIYLLFQHEYSANFLFTLWKRVRKYGACCTGLTQNVDDLLQSHTARTMLANSEFLVMLNQAATDRAELAQPLNISDNQLSYITNVDSGRGLIKCGSTIVPFMNVFPKNTRLYKLMSTKFMEQIDVT